MTPLDDRSAGTDVAPPVTWEDYARAERFLPWNAAKLLHGVELTPHWIDDGDTFWYRTTRRDGSSSSRSTPRRARASRRSITSGSRPRSARLGHRLRPARPPVSRDRVCRQRPATLVRPGEARWTCDLTTYACSRAKRCEPPPADASRSPDGRWDLFVREHNLWLRAVETGEERALTDDGEPGYGYGATLASPLVSAGLAAPDTPVAIWSPDSRRFVSCRIDQRLAQYLHLVQSVPKDGTASAAAAQLCLSAPGDEAVPQAEVWCFGMSGEEASRRAPAADAVLRVAAQSELALVERGRRPGFLLTRERGYLGYRLHDIDTATGRAARTVEERAERGIDPYLLWAAVNIRVIADGAQVIWYGPRDGWGHLYLYDTKPARCSGSSRPACITSPRSCTSTR